MKKSSKSSLVNKYPLESRIVRVQGASPHFKIPLPVDFAKVIGISRNTFFEIRLTNKKHLIIEPVG